MNVWVEGKVNREALGWSLYIFGMGGVAERLIAG